MDGNADVEGALLLVSVGNELGLMVEVSVGKELGLMVGNELGVVLLDRAFEATTTMTKGSVTVSSDESRDPMIIDDIATIIKIAQSRI